MKNKNVTILLVEDDEVDQTMYQRFLTRAFEHPIFILVKSDGQSALTYLKENTVDCILLDYQLPDMSGIEFVRHLSSDAKIDKTTPIVMLTGQGDEKVAVNALKLGVFDYYVKADLTQHILHSAVMNAIEKAALSKKIAAQELEIKFMAYHDPLTGVANRTEFNDRANQSLLRAERFKKKMAIFFIDLDRFKNINDAFGHDAGDMLLQEVTKRFCSISRKIDTVARFGGDEFAIILDSIRQIEDVKFVAIKLLKEIRKPFVINGHECSVSASIGIAIYPDSGSSILVLTNNADKALYEAKKNGKDRYCVFSDQLT